MLGKHDTKKAMMVAIVGIGLIVSVLSIAHAGEIPPVGSLSLSAIIELMEEQKLGTIDI